MQGSFFKVMSPLLDLKYNDNITEDFKLPPPTRVVENSGSETFQYIINIVSQKRAKKWPELLVWIFVFS